MKPNPIVRLLLSSLLPLLLLPLSMTACDDGPGRTVIAEALIGPAGGVLDSGDGRVRLVVPPGALDAETSLSIATAEATADLVPGSTFDFAPDGTRFALPATLTVAFDPSALPPGALPTDLAIGKRVRVDGEDLVLVEDEGRVDEAARAVTGRIEGFSTHGAVIHLPCERFTGTITAEYNPNRTISLAWQSPLSVTSVEVARLTDVQLGTPGAVWPREQDYQTWLTTAPGTWQTTYPAGSEAALLYFRVRTRCRQTLAPPSDPAMVAVFGEPRAPYPPGAFRATATAPDRVALQWTGDAWATGYEVERSLDASTWQPLPGSGAQRTSIEDWSGLSPSTLYYYRVRARGSVGNSQWVLAWARPPAPSAPPSPTGLAASATSPTSLAFTWVLDPQLADEVHITRTDPASGVPTPLATLPSTRSTFEDRGLTPDAAYTYELTSTRSGSPGGTASITVRTPPLPTVAPPPPGPTGTPVTGTCALFDLAVSPGVAVLQQGMNTLDITVTRKAGFTGDLALTFERWCDGRFPLCEVAQLSFCDAACEHEYTGYVPQGDTSIQLAIELYFTGGSGWSTEFDIVDPAYPDCRVTIPVQVP